MFGHQDDKKDHDKHDESEQVEPQQNAPAVDAVPETGNVQAGGHGEQRQDAPADGISGDGGQTGGPVDDDQAWQQPGEPVGDDSQKDSGPADDSPKDETPEPISDIIGPAGGNPNPAPVMPINARDIPDDDDKVPHELIDIKQKALGELKPMLSKLELPPEDRFRTLMMIIQASDNQDMIKQAYDVAEDIKDEKARAQALLDIVNEINYFTQHSS